jgi:hypothetical protein
MKIDTETPDITPLGLALLGLCLLPLGPVVVLLGCYFFL